MKEQKDRYEIFLKVCETGSFSKAAEALNYTQSGISQMMAGLEEELGVQLFVRVKRGVSLTDNGARLIPYIQEMVNQKDKLRQAAFNINNKIEGKLRVGSFSSITALWMPDVVHFFRENYPKVDVEIFDGNYDEIRDWIIHGQVDCGFLSSIVADDLTPSETVQMDKRKILAFVTVHGSTNSHTAILARMMNIPALIGVPVELDSLHSGTMGIVDGKDAVFCVDPDEATIAAAHEMQARAAEQKRLLANYKGRPSVTKSGRKVNVYANIGSVSDVAYVQENDAEGIGLFRSEFLYLGKTALPDETEQFNTYRQVLQTMGGKKVIIRTLDIGADKNVDYLGLGKEDNPAMGYRAIRICLKQPDVFKTQLRALLRAAKYGNLAIMYPMIISVDEVLRIREIVAEVAAELKREQIPYAIPEQGIMIETPAAVMICEELAELVDFFSIGTNDLTQYTLAIDRQNEKLDEFYNPHHEAVLRMIQMTIDGAHKAGKWAGICGELGADTTLTERFVEMGIDELSVAPSMVLSVRSKICEMA